MLNVEVSFLLVKPGAGKARFNLLAPPNSSAKKTSGDNSSEGAPEGNFLDDQEALILSLRLQLVGFRSFKEQFYFSMKFNLKNELLLIEKCLKIEE
jgi:hypothetical protein